MTPTDVEPHPRSYYRPVDCPNCGRHRVLGDGICEKCGWDVDGDDYEIVTRAPAQCILCHDDVDEEGRCKSDNWHGLRGL